MPTTPDRRWRPKQPCSPWPKDSTVPTPGAAASLREGLHETLTVLRLGVPPTLGRTLRSTNAIESMISVCREHAANVKRWRDGQMALRWCAAGMIEARQAIPPRQRSPAPTHTPSSSPARNRRTCRTRPAQ
jgi:putative transposase